MFLGVVIPILTMEMFVQAPFILIKLNIENREQILET